MNCQITIMEPASTITKVQNTNNSTTVRFNDDFFNALTTLTIDECEKFFEEHYENNIEQFSSNLGDKKMSLLRSCIGLLNRLEGDATHNLFAGRVLIFLARVIPLFDQSGINIKSDFSAKKHSHRILEKLKQISKQNVDGDKKSQQLNNHQDMEEGETISDDDSNEPLPQEDCGTIFERFWGVKQFLDSPNLLYDKDNWFKFRKHIDAIVYRMETKPATSKLWLLKNSYMTDQETLAIQFNDVNMRRCFLVQILVVLQYLELPVEARPESYILDKGQSSWSSSVVRRIYGILDVMPNLEEGRKFLGYVRQILRREEMWNEWKNDKCQELKTLTDVNENGNGDEEEDEVINMRGTYHKRRKISDELSSAKPYNMHVIGSQDMSRLWNMKSNQRFNTPTVGKYLNISQEKQDECFQDPNYSFRVLRLLRKSPHFFEQTSAVIQSLDLYLKNAASRYLQSQNNSTKIPTNDATINTKINSTSLVIKNPPKNDEKRNNLESEISHCLEANSKDSSQEELSNAASTTSPPDEVKTSLTTSPIQMEAEDSIQLNHNNNINKTG